MKANPIRITLYLILLTHLVFFPVVTFHFLNYDDGPYVHDNPMVCRGLSREGLVWAWTTFHAGNWHPLTWLSHMLDWQLFGDRPGLHHYVNLVLHLANTVGLFLVLRAMTRAGWRSALVAALFALHPLHVESVAWVAERKDVLSTFFGIVALGAYARYAAGPGVFRYLVVLAAFTLSLLAKPMLVTLPFVFLLLDWWPLRRWIPAARVPDGIGPPGDADRTPAVIGQPAPTPGGRVWLLVEKVPLLVLSAASCVVTVIAQRGAMASLQRYPVSFRMANAVLAYVGYLRKMAWPDDLAILYPFPVDQPPLWHVVGAALFLLALTALAVGLRHRCPAFLVGWLWYLGTLVPVIGLVQVGVQTMADRYTYVPLIGIFLALAFAVPAAVVRQRWGRVVAAALAGAALVACAAGTILYLRCWRDDGTVWRRDLQVTVDNPVAHLNMGGWLYKEGKVDEAEEEFLQAVRLAPNYALPMNNLGTSLWRRGRLDEALAWLSRAVEVEPREVLARNSMGLVLFQKGQFEASCQCFREAVRLAPEAAQYHYNLGTALEEKGDHPGAVLEYQEGLRLDPAWPQKAHQMAQESLTTKNPKLRCPAEALFRAKQACQATGDRQPEMLDTLATAEAATGKLVEAIATEKKASELAGATQPELADQIQGHLHHFQEALAKKSSVP